MIVWDQGSWHTEADPVKQLAKGHLAFALSGQKLAGRWHLVRLRSNRAKRRSKTARENWLLIKADDEAAAEAAGRDILVEAPKSVKSGRTIEEIERPKTSGAERSKRRRKTAREPAPEKAPAATEEHKPKPKPRANVTVADRDLPREAIPAPLPEFVAPALATMCEKPPAGPRWLHELKFDGYRLLARVDRGRVKLRTRSGLDWTGKFSSLVPELAALSVRDALIDGEVVVESEAGVSSFSDLQADLAAGRTSRLVYYAFDLLHLDGKDLQAAPLRARRELLAGIVGDGHGAVRFSGHFDEDGTTVLKHACRLGLEGIVSKRRDAPYRSGRTKVWTKSKCTAGDEFVVVGYTPSTVQRRAIGALVLARRENEALVHAGRVGTGFSTAMAETLWERLELLEQPEPAVPSLAAETRRGVRWVAPRLVAAVEYRGLTSDSLLRHAAFKGLRDDKRPEDLNTGPMPRATKSAGPAATPALTHADRLLWPADGVTKEGLAAYLTDVWPRMAPLLTGRPLALVRCPNGIDGTCFFQKHRFAGIGRDILVTADPTDGKDILSVTALSGVIALAQASVCEIHTWGSRLAHLERPDMVTFDLDPAEDMPWQQVIEAAAEVRARLAHLSLASFVKTSGGKGLHVVLPLKPRAEWPFVKSFAEALARSMSADSPHRYTAVLSKRARKGRIFIDYLRNGRGATTVAAYSPRSRPGAAVSMPLAWEELGEAIKPGRFTVENAANRLSRQSVDPWADFFAAAKPLPRVKLR